MWMLDCDNLDAVTDQSHNRVLRGGSWINNGQRLRAAYRNNDEPNRRNDNNGFRLAGAYKAEGQITRSVSSGLHDPQNQGSRRAIRSIGSKARRRTAFWEEGCLRGKRDGVE